MHKLSKIFLLPACIALIVGLASCGLFPSASPDHSQIDSLSSGSNSSFETDVSSSLASVPAVTEETFAVETTAGSFAETSDSAHVSENRINVTAPDGWEENSSPTFIARYTKGDAFFLVAEETFFSSNDLDTVAEEATTTLLAVFENAALDGDVEDISIDGYDGRRFILTSTINGVPTTSSYTYIVLGDRVFSLVFSQTSDLWPSFTDDEETFLSGIRIS